MKNASRCLSQAEPKVGRALIYLPNTNLDVVHRGILCRVEKPEKDCLFESQGDGHRKISIRDQWMQLQLHYVRVRPDCYKQTALESGL